MEVNKKASNPILICPVVLLCCCGGLCCLSRLVRPWPLVSGNSAPRPVSGSSRLPLRRLVGGARAYSVGTASCTPHFAQKAPGCSFLVPHRGQGIVGAGDGGASTTPRPPTEEFNVRSLESGLVSGEIDIVVVSLACARACGGVSGWLPARSTAPKGRKSTHIRQIGRLAAEVACILSASATAGAQASFAARQAARTRACTGTTPRTSRVRRPGAVGNCEPPLEGPFFSWGA